MSKTKGGGSTRNGRDSNAQRLGVKVFDGTKITAGTILIRQRGTKVHPGNNVGIGKDDTLFALSHGSVKFGERRGRNQYPVDVANWVCVAATKTKSAALSRLTKLAFQCLQRHQSRLSDRPPAKHDGLRKYNGGAAIPL